MNGSGWIYIMYIMIQYFLVSACEDEKYIKDIKFRPL